MLFYAEDDCIYEGSPIAANTPQILLTLLTSDLNNTIST